MKLWLRTLVSLVVCLAGQTATHAEPLRVLKASTPGSNDAGHRFLMDLKAGVEARAPGRLRVDVYSNSTLGPIPTAVEGLSMGTIELVNATVGFYVGLDPRFSVLDAAGVFDSAEHAQRALNDPILQERLKSFGKERDVEALMFYTSGPLLLLARTPIVSLADLKGLLVRVPGAGPLHMEPFRHVGANPITMSLGDALPALQNRTIDATIAGAGVFVPYKYYDVAKHVTEIPGSFLIVAVLVNRSVLRTLGPELEGIVRDEAAKAALRVPERNTDDIARMQRIWAENGGKFHVLNAADRQRFGAQTQAVVDRLSATSPSWKDAYEALQAAARRQRR